jgi:hypothetical protein
LYKELERLSNKEMFVRRGGGRGSVYFPSPEGAVYPDNQSIHFTLHASVGWPSLVNFKRQSQKIPGIYRVQIQWWKA